jgi:hypothetical protein
MYGPRKPVEPTTASVFVGEEGSVTVSDFRGKEAV